MTAAMKTADLATMISSKTSAPHGHDGRLTVVVPTYNHAHFIGQALDSVFAQSRLPERVLVLDDGSTDDTAGVIQPYLARTLPVEYVRMTTNRGVVPTINAGLRMLESEFVVFLAADDILAPAAFEKSLGVLTQNPHAALCGMFVQLIDEDGGILKRPRDLDFGSHARYVSPEECLARLHRDGGLFGGNGVIYRTRHLQDGGGFSPDLMAFCDGFRIQELALRYGVCIVPEPLVTWRQRTTSYAATSRSDPGVSLAILTAVRGQLQAPSSVFPRTYGLRLEKRLRYGAAAATLAVEQFDPSSVQTAIGAAGLFLPRLFVGLRRVFGARAANAALLLYLRPFDIVPGILRRVRKIR